MSKESAESKVCYLDTTIEEILASVENQEDIDETLALISEAEVHVKELEWEIDEIDENEIDGCADCPYNDNTLEYSQDDVDSILLEALGLDIHQTRAWLKSYKDIHG